MSQLDGKQIKAASIPDSALVNAPGRPTSADKFMTASVTTADGDVACATGITATPAGHSMVEVQVNGAAQNLKGDKTGDCYFSVDSGTTARALNAITAADKLIWNGSIAGFQLAVTDKISFLYDV